MQMQSKQLGWQDWNEKEKRYRQVKAANGGGTRHVDVEKSKTIEELKQKICSSNGLSKKH